MAKKKKIYAVPAYTATNPLDGKVFSSTASHQAAVDAAVSYFEKTYSDRKALCYDTYGRTWDAQYDTCLKALHNTSAKLEQALKERDNAAAQQRSLAAKLNAIVLVLRNDA